MLKPTAFTATNGTVLVAKEDGSLLATAKSPETEVYAVTAPTDLKGITGTCVVDHGVLTLDYDL